MITDIGKKDKKAITTSLPNNCIKKVSPKTNRAKRFTFPVMRLKDQKYEAHMEYLVFRKYIIISWLSFIS